MISNNIKKPRCLTHALDKIFERSSLTPGIITGIIANGLTIPIGHETGSNRRHLLFYSMYDEKCFVAVYDQKMSLVITLLPVNYHNRWRIDPETEIKAKELALSSIANRGKEKYRTRSEDSPQDMIEVFFFSIIQDDDRRKVRKIPVGRWRMGQHADSFRDTLNNPAFLQEIQTRLRQLVDQSVKKTIVHISFGRKTVSREICH